MAEESVKRVTGLNPLLLARSSAPPTMGLPFVSSSPMDVPTNAAIPMQPNPNQFLHRPPPSISTAPLNHHSLDCGLPNNTHIPGGNPRNDSGGKNATEPPRLQRAISIEHAQQQIGNRVDPSRGVTGWDSGLTHTGAKSDKQN